MFTEQREKLMLHQTNNGRLLVRPDGTVRFFVEGTSNGANYNSIADFDSKRRTDLLVTAISVIVGRERINLMTYSQRRKFNSLKHALAEAQRVARSRGFEVYEEAR